MVRILITGAGGMLGCDAVQVLQADHELVPLKEDWRDYFAREVKPFAPDAWVDQSYTDDSDKQVGRVGYEINFNRYFYTYTPPRPLEEIDAELKTLEADIAALLKEVVA